MLSHGMPDSPSRTFIVFLLVGNVFHDSQFFLLQSKAGCLSADVITSFLPCCSSLLHIWRLHDKVSKITSDLLAWRYLFKKKQTPNISLSSLKALNNIIYYFHCLLISDPVHQSGDTKPCSRAYRYELLSWVLRTQNTGKAIRQCECDTPWSFCISHDASRSAFPISSELGILLDVVRETGGNISIVWCVTAYQSAPTSPLRIQQVS